MTLRTYTRLRAVPAPAGDVISLTDRIAARDARRARLDERRRDQFELAAVAGTLPDYPDGAPPQPDPDLDPEFPPAVRILVAARFDRPRGGCDLWASGTGDCWGPLGVHHVEPKGSGGTRRPGLAVASNGALLCAVHHGWVHHNAVRAGAWGLLRSKLGASRLAAGVMSVDGGRTWVKVDNAGKFRVIPPPGGDAT